MFGHLHFCGLERTPASAVGLALPGGCALTSSLKLPALGRAALVPGEEEMQCGHCRSECHVAVARSTLLPGVSAGQLGASGDNNTFTWIRFYYLKCWT